MKHSWHNELPSLRAIVLLGGLFPGVTAELMWVMGMVPLILEGLTSSSDLAKSYEVLGMS